MVLQVVDAVPEWLLVGVLMGAAATVLVATMFVLGERLFPAVNDPATDGGRSLSGDARRRAEIREYLGAIGESFAEDHPVEGQVAAFYLPQRGVAVTFDVEVFFRLRNGDTHVVLCEHEMPGRTLGGRLPFETPEVDLGDDPASPAERRAETVRQAYAELDLRPSATPEEVRRAYRKKVKEVHPDHGGDEERFRQVREAYTVATDHADGAVRAHGGQSGSATS